MEVNTKMFVFKIISFIRMKRITLDDPVRLEAFFFPKGVCNVPENRKSIQYWTCESFITFQNIAG